MTPGRGELVEQKAQQERVLTVVYTGPAGSGKSSILAKQTGAVGPILASSTPAVRIGFGIFKEQDPSHPTQFNVWDLPGQAMFQSATKTYSAQANIVVFVVDGCDILTETDRARMVENARALPHNVPRILVINKRIRRHEAGGGISAYPDDAAQAAENLRKPKKAGDINLTIK